MHLDLKEAVAIVQNFAVALFGAETLENLRLEEVEASRDESEWLVTLGWTEPTTATQVVGTNPLLGALGPANTQLLKKPRVYKQFVVDDLEGEVIAVKIRTV